MHNVFQPVVFGVIMNGSQFLLTLRDDRTPDGDTSEFHNMWQLPGGGVDFGEELEDALRRECREEVGLDIDIMRTIPYIQSGIRKSWHGIFITYEVVMKHPDQKVVLNEEASSYIWTTFDEARTMNLTPMTLRILEQVFTTS